jgi:hypothetical protein
MRVGVLLASCALVLGVACINRSVVPLVYEPRSGEPDSFPLVVQVTDAKTAEPLIAATVEIWGNDPRATTDLHGLSMLFLHPGRYTLMAKYTGYLPARRLIRFSRENWPNIFDIRLQPIVLDLSH